MARGATPQGDEDPKEKAMNCVQEVDSDLSVDELAGIIELFEQDHDSAKVYLAIKTEGVWKAWIKQKLALKSDPSREPGPSTKNVL